MQGRLECGVRTKKSRFLSLRLGTPRHAHRFYFAALWPEAEKNQRLLDGEGLLPCSARLTRIFFL